MAKRRASGDGMVRKLKRGLWEGRVVIGHKKDGSPIFKYAYAHTQKELGEKLRALDGAYHDRDLTEEMMLTLQTWLERWCRESLPLTMRASTAERCRAMIQNHIVPRLGQKRLADLTTDDIQKFCNELRKGGRLDGKEGGLSDTMVLRVCNLLHRSLDAAVRARLIPTNPADGVQLPKRRRAQKQILNDGQLNTLLKAIEGDEDWHDFFYTELTTGLRRGEICALRWDDFDEADGRLHVRRTLKKEGGALVCGDTKTYAGRRAILLPPSTAELLRARKRASFTEWIFPNPLRPEQPMNPTTAYENMKRILKRAGLPSIRFHDLRHTFATEALEHGMDVKTLSAIIGHVSAATTLNIYAHVTDAMQAQAARKIDRGIVGRDAKAPQEGVKKAPLPPSDFTAARGGHRKPGTGCISQISETLWEGRYSPVWPDGRKRPRNIYAHSEAECEAKLAAMIVEEKAKIAAERERMRSEA